MKKSLLPVVVLIVTAIILVPLMVFGLSKALQDKEHRYHGRSLQEWKQDVESQNKDTQYAAKKIVSQTIIPELINTMRSDTTDSRIKLSLVENLNALPGVSIQFTDADGRRRDAAHDLGFIGTYASVAIPALLQVAEGKDSAVRGAAIESLGKIHSEPETIIPVLIKFLDEEGINENAAEALGEFGKLSAAAIPKLLELSKIPDKGLRHAIIVALRQIQPEAALKAEAIMNGGAGDARRLPQGVPPATKPAVEVPVKK